MLIAVASPKGGVGKTTCAAHLAYGIAAAGYRTLALDLDPQNSLRLHFGIPLGEAGGLARGGPPACGLFLVPGRVSHSARSFLSCMWRELHSWVVRRALRSWRGSLAARPKLKPANDVAAFL